MVISQTKKAVHSDRLLCFDENDMMRTLPFLRSENGYFARGKDKLTQTNNASAKMSSKSLHLRQTKTAILIQRDCGFCIFMI